MRLPPDKALPSWLTRHEAQRAGLACLHLGGPLELVGGCELRVRAVDESEADRAIECTSGMAEEAAKRSRMSLFQSTTELSWPLPLRTSAGREPPIIMTIGDAANFAEDEIRLGLDDDALWRQCFARLAHAYDSPGNQLLLAQATTATQLALYGNRLLGGDAAGRRLTPHADPIPTQSSALHDRAPQREVRF